MKKALLIPTALGLALVGASAGAQSIEQNGDDKWDGPGFYAEDLATMQSDGSRHLFKEGGPFSSYGACQTYLSQHPHAPLQGWTDAESCVYRGSAVAYEDTSCFLTTACTQHAGLADDCEELTLMRAFRDRHLRGFDEGRRLIEHYYAIAPGIVRAIHASPDEDRVLAWVLRQVRATARAVGRGEGDQAIARYAAMVLRLQERFAPA